MIGGEKMKKNQTGQERKRKKRGQNHQILFLCVEQSVAVWDNFK